jgi:hypothetical protein
MMREKVRPNRSSVDKVNIYHNNQNAIAIVTVRPNIDDSVFSRSENCAHLNHVKENRIFGPSQ